MFKFPSFRPKASAEPRHERFNEENTDLLMGNVVAGVDFHALEHAMLIAGDRDETTCLIPFEDGDAGMLAADTLRTLLTDPKAHWFKTNLQELLPQLLKGEPKLDGSGQLVVDWSVLPPLPDDTPRDLSGNVSSGD